MTGNDERIAKWRARREAGQASREAHPELPTDYALIASEAEKLASGDAEAAEPILELVLASLRKLPNTTVSDRRQVYDAVARGIERGIDRVDPHSDYAELRRRQLRAVVRLVEADARQGIEIDDVSYRPAEFGGTIDPLLAGYNRRQRIEQQARHSQLRRQAVLADEAYTIALPPEEAEDLDLLRQTVARIDAGYGARRSIHSNLQALKALLRYQFALLRAESRLALIWTLVGPAAIIALLSVAYFLIGTHTILNMDVPTFSMIGATTWFMFRNVIFRTTTGNHSKRALHNFRAFSPAMTGLTDGLIYLSSYTAVYAILIVGGHAIDLFTLPDDLPGVVFWILCMGVCGMAIGTLFGSIAVLWPYFPRLAPVIERTLLVVSSVFIVSEQLPSEYRGIVLWSPFAHSMQLLRSAYFESYKSEDANLEYFFIWMAVLIIAAALSQRLVRSRSNPA